MQIAMRSLKLWVIGLGAFAGTQPAFSQGGFIKHYGAEQAGHGALAKAIKPVLGGYLFFCDQISSDGFQRTHASIRRLDLEGNELTFIDLFNGFDVQANFGLVDPVISLLDTAFAVTIGSHTTGYGFRNSIYLFDLFGNRTDSILLAQNNPADSIGTISRNLAVRSLSGYYAVGIVDSVAQQAPGPQTIVWKIDGSGQVAWQKEFGLDGQSHAGISIEEYMGNGVAVYGYRGQPSAPLDANFLLRVDSNGTELWRRYFGNRSSASYGVVKQTNDGDLITWCTYREIDYPSYEWAQLMITRWTPDGDIVWQKKSHYGFGTASLNLAVLPDNSMIGSCGLNWDGGLCKFAPNGDSLWTRTFRPFIGVGEVGMWDVEPTPDGGFIACGEMSQSMNDPNPGLYTVFIVKTDSFGCVVPGCQNIDTEIYELELHDKLVLAPNPAHDRVRFELPLPGGYPLVGTVQAILLDAQGKEVLRNTIGNTGIGLNGSLDVSVLPSGMYFLHLMDAEKWLAGGNVVVE